MVLPSTAVFLTVAKNRLYNPTLVRNNSFLTYSFASSLLLLQLKQCLVNYFRKFSIRCCVKNGIIYYHVSETIRLYLKCRYYWSSRAKRWASGNVWDP